MAAVIPFDRRAAHFVGSKPEWLDRTNDIDALAAETYHHLERAHEAHWTNQPTAFLRSITRAGENVVRIGKIAREASGVVESAPSISPDQLALWVRPDGAVVSDGKTAA